MTERSLNQLWLHQFLQPVMDLLSEEYTAVGLVEQWNASIQLYQAGLKVPGMDWQAASRKVGKTSFQSLTRRRRRRARGLA